MPETESLVTLRAARVDDYAAICGLITSPGELFLVFPGGRYPLTVRQVHLLTEKRSDLTVATDATGIIGFANLYDIMPDQFAFIGNLIVRQCRRGKGTGTRLLEHMLDIVFERYRLPEARISVFQHNLPAYHLYRRFGFSGYAEEQRWNSVGQRVALLHMKLAR